MEFFAPNHEIVRLESLLPALAGEEQCITRLMLAWYLRQQSVARAEELVVQVESDMLLWFDQRQQQLARARLQLIRSEIRFLQLQDRKMQAWATQALELAQALGDNLLQSDAHSLLGFICGEIGEEEARRQHRHLGRECAMRAGDPVRALVAELAMGFVDVLSRAPRHNWDHWVDAEQAGLHPAVLVVLNNLIGIMPGRRQYSVQNFIKSFEAACESGQLRAAIVAASNIADHLNELNEHEAALEWNSRALTLARPSGWNGALALALLQTGETMRHLGRFDTAQDLLLEGLQLVECWPYSRNYAIGLLYLGELALASERFEDALDYFTQLQQRADHLHHLDFQTLAQRGRAHALLKLDQADSALQVAQEAWQLALATNDIKRQIDVLMVLAAIHAGHVLADPDAAGAATPSLFYLQMAHDLGSQIDGYNMDTELFDALGNEYARLGQYSKAYEMARQGAQMREKTHTAQATQRAIAMQIRYQTERAQAEGERDRQLAAEKARHLALLQQTRNTLEHLDAIGQEITAQLDLAAVFRVLDQHVHQLLAVTSFAVYLLESEQQHLVRSFAMENRQRLMPRTLSLDDTRSLAVRCLQERKALVLEWPVDNTPLPGNQEPGTLNTLSALYTPLLVGERVLGVMSIQSVERAAFGEREQLIFHTLCSYAAIALDNANAYRQLLQTQSQLVEQEKLAALGGLVAGVAHELNTPLGNCLMVSSSLGSMSVDLQARLTSGSVQRSFLENCLEDSALEIQILDRGLAASMNLVSSFQQVVVDRSNVQRRRFDLQGLANDIVQRMGKQIAASGHRLRLEVASGWQFDSYPGPLGQVLELLIENALQHAFADHAGGDMCLLARSLGPGRVRLQFEDNGAGIAPEHLKQVFEPFFTSKMGQGRCGLGLSIAYNIVNTLLNGQISVKSSLGHGTCVTLDLPLSVQEA